MRVFLVDDERPSLELLKRVISKNENLEIVGEFTDAQYALEQADILLPDVVFADIEMPYLNGLSFASMLKDRDGLQVVFVTAYERYALEAFEVNAVNYILKPITEESLDITVKRLLKHYKPPKDLWDQRRQNKILSLGSLQIFGNREEEPVKWPTAKTKELFSYLLCEKDRELDRWQLCEILWPDSVPEKALHSLHSTMNRMKSALKEAGAAVTVQCIKGKYAINLNLLLWDAEELVQYLKKNGAVTKENALTYEQTLDLYQGGLFESEGYLWALERSENVKRFYLEARANLAAYYVSCENYYYAEKHLKKILDEEPSNEDSVDNLMALYALTGNKIMLTSCYKRLEVYLNRELNTCPRESTRKRYREYLECLQK